MVAVGQVGADICRRRRVQRVKQACVADFFKQPLRAFIQRGFRKVFKLFRRLQSRFFLFAERFRGVFLSVEKEVKVFLGKTERRRRPRRKGAAQRFGIFHAAADNLPYRIGDKAPVFGTDVAPVLEIFVQNIVSRPLVLQNFFQCFNNGLNSACFFHLLLRFDKDKLYFGAGWSVLQPYARIPRPPRQYPLFLRIASVVFGFLPRCRNFFVAKNIILCYKLRQY